jgi:polyphenol oxidase
VAEALTSAMLAEAGFRHAFFTRRGGVSPAPWESLNFAANTGDEPARVAENLGRAAAVLGVDVGRIYFLSQVHGVDARRIDEGDDRSVVARAEGDVTLSGVPGVACGVRSADCVPVLIADRASGAVAAVHSGWRGTVQDVVRAGISALRALSGESGDLVAAIGPHIEACCFEVGADVAAELTACSAAGERALAAAGPKPRIDLRQIVRAQIEAAGIPAGQVDDVRGCTVCAPGLFHSYRRDGARSGRLLSAIVARRPARCG